ncbi:MAG TPA: UDP-N-acetylmuramoyl-L-alanine--D-glutamate ligase [Candidatus Omnitrophota bacterium]|nr:UDP-N-acetylmuramoyl-L-alanine--D-glutamate ligase [Candidatus Omnitrophota bacterium]
MMDLTNKKVTILGARRSGVAVANLVSRLNGIPKISDSGSKDASQKDLEKLIFPQNVLMEWGGHTKSFVEDSDLVVLSPGVRIDAQPVLWARAKKIPVMGEIELAWRFCSKPVVAVTGSNGKTTVVTLITRILQEAGQKVSLCGNVGIPFCEEVLNLQDKDLVVMEASSFQLESIIDFRPHVAVILNFSQNHLDRHKDLDEYFDAKKRIFLNQRPDDYAVLNYEDHRLRNLAPQLKAKVLYFNSPDALEETSLRNPNQLAAIRVAKIFKLRPDVVAKVFAEFTGVEHRLEWVRTLDGVHFINDSKATTAEAGRWAMESFEEPIIMICGGRDKNIDFSLLRELAGKKVKKMLVIGEARDKLKKAFSDVVTVEECRTLEEAVLRARKSASIGDRVVLSPMCASFDMFLNFEERGRIFKKIVKELIPSLNKKFDN